MYTVIATIISFVLGYYSSKLSKQFSEKRTRMLERFEKLYAPFEKMILIHTYGAFSFSALDAELQNQFVSLLYNNYEYADSELKELIMRFKWTYPPAQPDPQESDKYFFLIERRISDVFNIFSKRLFLDSYCIKHADKVTKDWDALP
jgi:hypothetical protein